MNEDLYFWGMYKNKLKEIKEMDEQLVCSKCGSKRVYIVTPLKPIFADFDIPFKCKDCEHVGKPKIIKSGEKEQINQKKDKKEKICKKELKSKMILLVFYKQSLKIS